MEKVMLPCTMGDTCDYVTPELGVEYAMQLLDKHLLGVHEQGPAETKGTAAAPVKTGKIIRPRLELKDSYVEEERFDFFEHRWSEYKVIAGVKENLKQELALCLSDEAAQLVYGRYGHEGYTALTEEQLLAAIREMVVRTRNKLVTRHKLRKMVQSHDQPVQTFLSNLKATARMCEYKVKCEDEMCGKLVDFTDQMVMEQLTVGLADEDTQRKLFTKPDVTLAEAEKLVIAEEIGKLSQEDSRSVAGISQYKRDQRDAVTPSKRCKWCGEASHGKDADLSVRREKCTAWDERCKKCSRLGHFPKQCHLFKTRKPQAEKKQNETNAGVSEELLEIRIDGHEAPNEKIVGQVYQQHYGQLKNGHSKRRILKHMRFDTQTGKYVSCWSGRKMKSLPVEVRVDRDGYQDLSGTQAPGKEDNGRVAKRSAVADTGASVCCSGTDVLHSLGVDKKELLKTEVNLYAADRRKLILLGVLPVIVASRKVGSGELVEVRELLYIVEELGRLYVSREALAALGSIPGCFPEVPGQGVPSMEYAEALTARITELETKAPCGCPQRGTPPDTVTLPCPATEENAGRLRDFLISSYNSSTFNCCEHQPLPLMHGPPLEFKLKEGVNPFAVYTPARVPAHWEEKVKADIDRDVALGVLEPVPTNVEMTWCHRMVICRKHNGDPRRTIDLQPLNDASIRQCHPTAPPLQQASTVPHNQKKSVLDCWNGYHSVSIREEDRHLTTFYTPWGRYRYKTAPQGYNTSGDAYTHRYDMVVMGVQNMRRVIDDTLLHADSIEKAFYQVAAYLTLVGKNGIILNPDKFQFAADVVNWAGVRISADKVEPLPDHVQALRDFPVPKTLTDMRSYFALVNQVSPYYATQPELQPFRDLLKKNSLFYWDEILQKLFEESKNRIADKVLEGITLFEVGRWTGLMTDWCKQGIGYMLVQKYCKCEDITPVCCGGGWRVCMVGSRFTSSAEQNYAPVEGELLGVADGLHRTRYYTQGCEKLVIGVDHKPLLGILNDRPLEKIENGRLLRLKEKTLGWRFRVVHIPGSKNGGPDALSRAVPGVTEQQVCHLDHDGVHGDVPEGDVQPRVLARREVLAGIRSVMGPEWTCPAPEMDVSDEMVASMSLEARSISWDRVRREAEKDPSSKVLVQWIEEACPGPVGVLPDGLRQYWRVRESLRVLDGVAMYGDRTIIPQGLRQEVLVVLHSAHQGVTGMTLRAERSVFWPGITNDIQVTRDRCLTCHKNAPSQAKLPPVDPVIPQYPFEHVCMDYMTLHGHNYGVFVDRFTGWPGVYVGGYAADVVTVLARISEDYGVPRTCTTDGGPPYTSGPVKEMMATYDISHRLCSVGNPHANCRAELAVKSVKRMLRDNLTVTGQLDRVKFSRALLTYRNTPDRDTGLSPAMALFGRQLRDFLPTAPLMGSMWQEIADARETALAPRSTKQREKWSSGAKELPPLQLGDCVFIQNQSGNYPRKWDKRGKVVEIKGFDQYRVMLEGSRRITLRNRKFLRKFSPFLARPFAAPLVTVPNVSVVENKLPVTSKGLPTPAQPEMTVGHHEVGGDAIHGPVQGEVDRGLGADGRDRVPLPAVALPTTVVIDSPGKPAGEVPDTTTTSQPATPTSEITVSHANREETTEPRVLGSAVKVVPVRRSSRSTKGKTNRYDDYEVGDE